MTTSVLDVDIAIIGGGMAGLWALNRARSLGYCAVLFESGKLGGGQTGAAQGIIHSGLKYSFAGETGDNTSPLQAMPSKWADCFSGRGDVELQGCTIASPNLHIWSSSSMFPKRSEHTMDPLQSHLRAIPPANAPIPLQGLGNAANIYQSSEWVIDTRSVVERLARNTARALFSLPREHCGLSVESGRLLLNLPMCSVRSQLWLLCAGEGNQALVSGLGYEQPKMQRRPLQQVYVEHDYPHALFAHRLDNRGGVALTITSTRNRVGKWVWTLGGDLAAKGADLEPAQIIERAKQELGQQLPGVHLENARWRTLRLDRAEAMGTQVASDGAFLTSLKGGAVPSNVMVAWPHKFTLCPHLGQIFEAHLQAINLAPKHPNSLEILLPLGTPAVADSPADWLFL